MNSRLFVALIVLSPLAAPAVTVSNLTHCAYADTEVSTNFPVVIDFREMSRYIIDLSLDASHSNSVEVAIGTDADDDGNLAPEEAACTFGCDCGTWFCRENAKNRIDVIDTLSEAEVASGSRIRRILLLKKRRIDTAWNLVKVTRRGSAPASECAIAEGRLPGLKISIQ